MVAFIALLVLMGGTARPTTTLEVTVGNTRYRANFEREVKSTGSETRQLTLELVVTDGEGTVKYRSPKILSIRGLLIDRDEDLLREAFQTVDGKPRGLRLVELTGDAPAELVVDCSTGTNEENRLIIISFVGSELTVLFDSGRIVSPPAPTKRAGDWLRSFRVEAKGSVQATFQWLDDDGCTERVKRFRFDRQKKAFVQFEDKQKPYLKAPPM